MKYTCIKCVGMPGGSACTLTYDTDVFVAPQSCPFKRWGGFPTPEWEKVEELPERM